MDEATSGNIFEFKYPLLTPRGSVGIAISTMPNFGVVVSLFSAEEVQLAADFTAALGTEYTLYPIRDAAMLAYFLRTLRATHGVTHVQLDVNRPDAPTVQGHYYPIADVLAATEAG